MADRAAYDRIGATYSSTRRPDPHICEAIWSALGGAATALLTVHHWRDVAAGIAELHRVARRIVILTWDQRVTERFWLSREYLPQLSTCDEDAVTIDTVLELLGGAEVRPLPIPHDCTDGFLGAFWRRPQAYLDPVVRAGISTMAATEATLGPGLERL